MTELAKNDGVAVTRADLDTFHKVSSASHKVSSVIDRTLVLGQLFHGRAICFHSLNFRHFLGRATIGAGAIKRSLASAASATSR